MNKPQNKNLNTMKINKLYMNIIGYSTFGVILIYLVLAKNLDDKIVKSVVVMMIICTGILLVLIPELIWGIIIYRRKIVIYIAICLILMPELTLSTVKKLIRHKPYRKSVGFFFYWKISLFLYIQIRNFYSNLNHDKILFTWMSD